MVNGKDILLLGLNILCVGIRNLNRQLKIFFNFMLSPKTISKEDYGEAKLLKSNGDPKSRFSDSGKPFFSDMILFFFLQ